MNSFTYANYKKLLSAFKEDYTFSNLSKIKYSSNTIEKTVVVRHDIDQSLKKAYEMAKIESELGVQAVYYIFLKSPFYNIFSWDSEDYLHKIIGLGHDIGLHFDYGLNDNLTPSQVSLKILNEIEVMEDYLGVKLDSVSFHRPFNIEFFKKFHIQTYPHSYERMFQEEFKYLSDSRGTWRYGFPLDAQEFLQKKNFQILIHPIWWHDEDLGALNSIKAFIEDHSKDFKTHLGNELKAFWTSNGMKINDI